MIKEEQDMKLGTESWDSTMICVRETWDEVKTISVASFGVSFLTAPALISSSVKRV